MNRAIDNAKNIGELKKVFKQLVQHMRVQEEMLAKMMKLGWIKRSE